jgi:predicted phosphodiesterase
LNDCLFNKNFVKWYSCPMRYAIVSDIHGNLEAFLSVLGNLHENGGFDQIWCLGDIVGYGPDPHSCIELLRKQNQISVAGNHDLASVGMRDVFDFNRYAVMATEWTKLQLTEEDKNYLCSLPKSVIEGDFTLVHGSPRDPISEYIMSEKIAEENFRYFETKYCLVGHSHIPLVFASVEGGAVFLPIEDQAYITLENRRLIINPGGVGQPRDSDPRASYAIYDSDHERIFYYKVEYEVSVTQQKMQEAGLPEFLVSRLSYGR